MNSNLLTYVELSVVEADKRTGTNSMGLKEAFMVYLIETKVKNPAVKEMIDIDGNICTLWRRYNEFDMLHMYLEVTYPYIVIPPLPEKHAHYTWQKIATNRFDPDFVDRRRLGLENFVLRVASHPILCRDQIFHSFLIQEDSWRDTVAATGYVAKADSKLRVLSAGYRLKKTDKIFEDYKNYADVLRSNVDNLLKIRASMLDQLYGIHKVHGNYGRVFSEWSGLEQPQMGEALQKAGHYMDVYAQCIDSLLEEEEQFADQMKEYLYFADALKAVCRKHELLQLQVEKAEENLAAKAKYREQLLEDHPPTLSLVGMRKLVMGGGGAEDSVSVREGKVEQVQLQIKEAERTREEAEHELEFFSKNALKDVERFKEQMEIDLKEILSFYVVQQVKMCKKNMSIWKNARDSLEQM